MNNYTQFDLPEALRAINSIIHKCEKAKTKFIEATSHHTLLRNRLNVMYISKSLIEEKLSGLKIDSTKSNAISTFC